MADLCPLARAAASRGVVERLTAAAPASPSTSRGLGDVAWQPDDAALARIGVCRRVGPPSSSALSSSTLWEELTAAAARQGASTSTVGAIVLWRRTVVVLLPPPKTAPPPPTEPVLEVGGMDAGSLGLLLAAQDGDPPSEHLAAVCSRIEQLTQQKAPRKLPGAVSSPRLAREEWRRRRRWRRYGA